MNGDRLATPYLAIAPSSGPYRVKTSYQVPGLQSAVNWRHAIPLLSCLASLTQTTPYSRPKSYEKKGYNIRLNPLA